MPRFLHLLLVGFAFLTLAARDGSAVATTVTLFEVAFPAPTDPAQPSGELVSHSFTVLGSGSDGRTKYGDIFVTNEPTPITVTNTFEEDASHRVFGNLVTQGPTHSGQGDICDLDTVKGTGSCIEILTELLVSAVTSTHSDGSVETISRTATGTTESWTGSLIPVATVVSHGNPTIQKGYLSMYYIPMIVGALWGFFELL